MDSSVDLLCFIADFLYLFSDNLHYEKFQDGTVKCIEDEIPFELPEGWCWSRLVSLTAIITKGASPKWQGVDYTSSGIMFITSENVGVETLLLESPKFLPEKINEIQPRSILETHDILTNIVGASIGRTCEYTLVDSANTNQAVAIIRLIAIDMVSYVVKCLNSDYCVNLMFANQVNVARANLSLSSLANFLIPIPPLKEMYRIIAHLDCSLRHISGIQSSEDELRQLILFTKTKILDLAIRGKLVPQDPNDEPASVLLERIRAEKEELIKQGKIKRDKKESVIFKGEDNSYYEKVGKEVRNINDEIPFDLPQGWIWCRGYICFDGMENTKPQGDFFDYIDIDAIDNKKHCIKEPKHLPVTKAPSRASRAIKNGSVLFSLVRPYLENVALIEEKHSDCIASTGFYICNSNGMFKPDFMFFLMISRYVVNGLNQFIKGDNSPSISKDNIEYWLYPVPPINEQQAISLKVKDILSMIENIEESLS
nr:restriction endonuclease subunit S [Mediterraneibacter faecis]